MAEIMSVEEYAEAVRARKALHTELLESDIKATKAAIARLKTRRGIVEQRRQANSRATKYIQTARLAQNIAGLSMLQKASTEDKELGRQRLLAATAEMYGETVEEVAARQKGQRGRPKTTKHGLTMYKTGRCKCDKCRAANAAAQQRYQQNRAARTDA